jgi:hypothetical protein
MLQSYCCARRGEIDLSKRGERERCKHKYWSLRCFSTINESEECDEKINVRRENVEFIGEHFSSSSHFLKLFTAVDKTFSIKF